MKILIWVLKRETRDKEWIPWAQKAIVYRIKFFEGKQMRLLQISALAKIQDVATWPLLGAPALSRVHPNLLKLTQILPKIRTIDPKFGLWPSFWIIRPHPMTKRTKKWKNLLWRHRCQVEAPLSLIVLRTCITLPPQLVTWWGPAGTAGLALTPVLCRWHIRHCRTLTSCPLTPRQKVLWADLISRFLDRKTCPNLQKNS